MKISIFVLMIVLFSITVSAGIEVLSSAPVNFITSGDSDFKTAFLIQAVENGGSERIYFSNLPVSQGYLMKNTQGYISADSSNVFSSYTYNTRTFSNGGQIYWMTTLNGGQSKWFTGLESAQKWCATLGSQAGILAYTQAAKNGGFGWGNYYCFAPQLVGYIGDIGGYQYKWTETFSVYNSITKETQKIVLSDQSRANIYEYSPNRKVLIRYSFSGLNVNSYIPDLSSKYSVIFQDSGVKTIQYLPLTSMNDYKSNYAVWDRFVRDWLGGTNYQKIIVNGDWCITCEAALDPFYVQSQIRTRVSQLTAPKTISEIGWSPTFDQTSSTSGRINLIKSNNDMPISPVFSIKLDAEWVGVYQPVTKPVIVSFKADKTQYIEGDSNARFTSVVKNEGEIGGSIDYTLTCNPSTYVSINAIGTQTFSAGQTKTLTHNVQANTAGSNIKASCCLVVSDRSNPSIKSGPVCSDVTFIEANQCPDGMNSGDTTCSITGGILQCMKNADGVLTLQPTGTICPHGCSLDGMRAVCNAAPGCNNLYSGGRSCGDGLCEIFEEKGKKCECLEDCSKCGDGYCSKLEKEAGNCPQDCGQPPHCSDGIKNFDEEGIDCGGKDCLPCPKPKANWILIVFGSLGGLGVIAAIFLRLKKEGYFK